MPAIPRRSPPRAATISICRACRHDGAAVAGRRGGAVQDAGRCEQGRALAAMRLLPDLVLTPEGWQRERAVAITDGRIAAVQAIGASQRGDVPLPGRALLPGTVNSHCHTFQSLLRGLGDDLDFMGWRDRVLYPFSRRLGARGIEIGAAFAFAEMLRHGITTVVDFFYVQDGGNANAEAAIRAARQVGIRLVLARAF